MRWIADVFDVFVDDVVVDDGEPEESCVTCATVGRRTSGENATRRT